MQEEVRDKSVALVIKVGKTGARLTASMVKAAMRRYLERSRNPSAHHGRQTVKQLIGQGAGVKSIEITDKNIKSFEHIARKYGVDFAFSSINWNNYKITANDEVYQNISSSLSDTGTLITTLIAVITAVSMVLMILILSMSIRSRKREIGILLAVGIAKPAVILQYVLETLLIAIVAFPLAYPSSKQVAGTLGALFGKTAVNVVVTPEHFMLVAIVGGILLVAAVLVSCIPAMRLKPKQILSQME